MRGLGLCFCCMITLVATETDHDEPVTPINTCAMAGDEVELQCSLIADTLQYWKGSSQDIISENNTITANYRGKYAIKGKYNLCMFKIGFNDAGTYSCVDPYTVTQRFQAEVIVLEKSQTITSNATGNLILENEIIRYTCGVRYSGNMAPSMRWSLTSSDTVLNHETNNQPGLAQTYIDVNGDSSKNGNRFTCTSFFEAPKGSNNFTASNAPDCTKKKISSILTVHYKPRNTTITFHSGEIVESGATLYIGDVLQCNTESNPKPVTYKWIAVIGDKSIILGHSQTVMLHDEQFGNSSLGCTVTNYMGCDSNIEGSNTIVVDLNVTGTDDDNKVAQSNGLSGGEIAGIVLGLIIGLVVVVSIIIYKFGCSSTEENKNSTPNGEAYVTVPLEPIQEGGTDQEQTQASQRES